MTIDTARHAGAVTRELSSRSVGGRPAWVLAASRRYDTSPAELWDALTTPARLRRWFAPVSGDLRQGGRYQVEGNAGGEVTTCDAARELALTWEIGGQTGWLVLQLRPAGDDASLLRLEHTAHVPDDFWARYGPGATGVGWEHALLGLALHLAGDPRSAAELEAWLTGDAGKAFTGQLSDGWCGASIVAGTDPGAARAAADATTAFYTGG